LLKSAVGLRINPLNTLAGLQDIQFLADTNLRPEFLIIPKCESVEILAMLDQLLIEIRIEPLIIALLETVTGVQRCHEIAAHPNCRALAFGAYDYVAEAGCALTQQSLLAPRLAIASAANANGIMSLDSPYGDITDLSGARKDAEHAVSLGFSGKLCIHPKFIEDVNRAFSPSEEEMAEARQIIAAYEAAGTGVFQYRGKMVDRPVLLRAEKVLARAEEMSARSSRDDA
tara:strand:+ start:1146 stop:1832 length:687 start_codon:yes stop_codon:yes gene_type:complete